MNRTISTIRLPMRTCAVFILLAASLTGTPAISQAPGSSPGSSLSFYVPATSASAVDPDGTISASASDPAAPTTAPDNGFFHRLGRAYLADWAFARYGVTALNISPGASIANLESVTLHGPGAVIRTGLGKTQALTFATDIIFHF